MGAVDCLGSVVVLMSRGCTVVDHSTCAVVACSCRSETARLRLLMFAVAWVILDAEAEDSRVNIAVTHDQNGTEDWLGKEVENAVEDGFRVRRNDISSLAETPSNRIDKPEEDSPRAADLIGFADRWVKCSSILRRQS